MIQKIKYEEETIGYYTESTGEIGWTACGTRVLSDDIREGIIPLEEALEVLTPLERKVAKRKCKEWLMERHDRVKEVKDTFKEYPVDDEWHKGKIENILYNESILLIGPSGAGKSAVAEKLHEKTNLPRLCLDDDIANRDRCLGIRKLFKTADEYNEYLINKVLEKAKKRRKTRCS